MISESIVGEWIDNPIFVKHLRSRLRLRILIPAILIVSMIAAVIVAVGYEVRGFRSGLTYGMLLALQSIVFGLIGAAQVGSSVGGARTSGVMDFHCVSPLSSAELTLGFFFGAPILEYILLVVTFPFVLLCVLQGHPTLGGAVQILIVLVMSSWLLHGLAFLNALVVKRANAGKGTAALLVLLGIIFAPVIAVSGPSLTRFNVEARLDLFGYSLPWLIFVLIDESALLFFVLLACLRKMHSERLHVLSKPQAIVMFALFAVLGVGGAWKHLDVDILTLAILYIGIAGSMLLTCVVTPDRAEYTKGQVRVQKMGPLWRHWWSDLAWNRWFVVVSCAILLMTATIAWHFSPTRWILPNGGFSSMPLAIANGVLVAAYFGLALQYFLLRFGTFGGLVGAFFFFLAWCVPPLIGLLFASNAGPAGEQIALSIMALSPIAGITMASSPTPNPAMQTAQFTAIFPTLLFLFVFSTLAVSARRRIDRNVRSAFETATDTEVGADKLRLVESQLSGKL